MLHLLLIYSSLVWGKVNINKHEYSRYIRPQIRYIIQDFYFVVWNMHKLGGNVVTLKKNFGEFEKTRKLYFSGKVEIGEMYKSLVSFRQKIELLRLKKNQNQIWDNLLLKTLQCEGLLERIQMGPIGLKWEKELQGIEVSYQDILFSGIDEKVRMPFGLLWIDFIRPLEAQVEGNDIRGMSAQLGKLNSHWNSFHLQLSRGGNKIPPRILGMLKKIHNRWNLILKVALN